jgi:hypothetical protein
MEFLLRVKRKRKKWDERLAPRCPWQTSGLYNTFAQIVRSILQNAPVASLCDRREE